MVWYNPKIRLCSPTEHAEDHESGKKICPNGGSGSPSWKCAHAPDWSTLVHLGTETSETNFKAENAGVISSVRTGVQLKTKMNMDDSKRQPQLLCALQLGSDSRKNHSAFCIFLCCRVSLILQFLLYSLDCSSVAFRF